MSARIAEIDRVIRRVHIPVQLHRAVIIHPRRVPAEEATNRRVVVARSQVVQPGQRVELLAGVHVGVGCAAGLSGNCPKRIIPIRICDCAAGVGQGAGAALGVGEVVAGICPSALGDELVIAEGVAGLEDIAGVGFQDDVAVGREFVPEVLGDGAVDSL